MSLIEARHLCVRLGGTEVLHDISLAVEPGEIITVANNAVGTVKRYVPFNTEDGWHVEHILLEQLRERQCQIFVTEKDSRGNKVRKGKLIREFAIEVLDPLTEEERADLAQRQAMAKGQ